MMKLVDLKALSKQTSLSVSTIRKFIKLGMPHYRPDRKILVVPEEFAQWFNQFKSATGSSDNELDHLVDETLKRIG